MPAKKEPAPTQQNPDVALWQGFLDFYLHQDRLYWSSIQTLIAVQAGIHAAAYVTRTPFVGPAILILAGLPSLLLLALLVGKYRKDRDLNLKVLDRLAETCFPPAVVQQLKSENRWQPLRIFSSSVRRRSLLGVLASSRGNGLILEARGATIIGMVVFLVGLSDVVFALLYWFCRDWFPMSALPVSLR